ncbi:MAG: response regulator [Bacteroidetes bacterium]|nr:response regulator [Bacteroidota bacterium]MCL5737269.1 response regulator [Bacteroidota bacterium]
MIATVRTNRNHGLSLLNGSVYNILIVDDEPLICWSLENSLRKAGYRASSVRSAEQAFDKLNSSKFDLVITDMKLPQHDGFEIATASKQLFPKSVVMMITAYGDELSRRRATESGIDYFVDKPFNLSELVVLVNEILRRKRKGE